MDWKRTIKFRGCQEAAKCIADAGGQFIPPPTNRPIRLCTWNGVIRCFTTLNDGEPMPEGWQVGFRDDGGFRPHGQIVMIQDVEIPRYYVHGDLEMVHFPKALGGEIQYVLHGNKRLRLSNALNYLKYCGVKDAAYKLQTMQGVASPLRKFVKGDEPANESEPPKAA